MTFRVRMAVVPALLAGSVAAACSSSAPHTPGAYVNATLRTSATSPSTLCGFTSQDVVVLGTDTSPIPTRALDGDVTSTGRASISCSVAAKSDGFDINLSASVGGMGTLIVLGHVTSQGGETVTTSFQTTGGAFKSESCVFTYTYSGSPVSTTAGPAIAAGRVWGHVSCQAAVQTSGQMVLLPDGTMATRQCDGEVDFLFESCSS